MRRRGVGEKPSRGLQKGKNAKGNEVTQRSGGEAGNRREL